MKKQIVLALALLVSTLSFAQKSEIKAAEKAIKDNNFSDAKSQLKSAEPLIENADDKLKAKYYFLLGQALYANGAGLSSEMPKALESFEMVKTIENGKGKYSGEIDQLKTDLLNSLVAKGYKSNQDKRYESSAQDYNMAYRLSPKDTIYLYYAATSAIQGQHYDMALKYYEELKELKYDGSETLYTAVDKASGKEETFSNKTVRDASVLGGSHIAPKEKLTDSKLPLITKMLADIYIYKGEDDKATEAIKEARAANPDDLSLILSEANIELKLGNEKRFKELMLEAINKDPQNAVLRYNVGVMIMKEGEYDAARKEFNKALELDPTMKDAAINISTTYIEEGNKLVEVMNNLGTSDADFEKYDELKLQKSELFKQGAIALEKYLETNEGNNDLYQQLNSIYLAIGEVDKANMYKAKIKE
jgi:tetratricopeptide (TPR) repeat protein